MSIPPGTSQPPTWIRQPLEPFQCEAIRGNEKNDLDDLKSRLSQKSRFLDQLNRMELSALWRNFLSNQVALCFPQEVGLFSQSAWWLRANTVLDIGSGNAEYLLKLAGSCGKNKQYLGVEQKADLVEQANQRTSDLPHITSIQGDASELNPSLIGNHDVVVFRLVLQHLQRPLLAIKHACQYLRPGGHMLIIDACDSFRKTSHPLLHCDAILSALNEKNRQRFTGNRSITLQLLGGLKEGNNDLARQLEIVFTNLDERGEAVPGSQQLLWQSEEERVRYMNHALHFLKILEKDQWKLAADLSIAYDELRVFLDDPHAWIRPGQHVMVLKKHAEIPA